MLKLDNPTWIYLSVRLMVSCLIQLTRMGFSGTQLNCIVFLLCYWTALSYKPESKHFLKNKEENLLPWLDYFLSCLAVSSMIELCWDLRITTDNLWISYFSPLSSVKCWDQAYKNNWFLYVSEFLLGLNILLISGLKWKIHHIRITECASRTGAVAHRRLSCHLQCLHPASQCLVTLTSCSTYPAWLLSSPWPGPDWCRRLGSWWSTSISTFQMKLKIQMLEMLGWSLPQLLWFPVLMHPGRQHVMAQVLGLPSPSW